MENIFIYKIILRIYIENIFIYVLEIILFNIYTKNAYNKLIYIKNNNNAIYYSGHLRFMQYSSQKNRILSNRFPD